MRVRTTLVWMYKILEFICFAWEEDEGFQIVGIDGVSSKSGGVQEDFQLEELD